MEIMQRLPIADFQFAIWDSTSIANLQSAIESA
jgi:hypothetical protein